MRNGLILFLILPLFICTSCRSDSVFDDPFYAVYASSPAQPSSFSSPSSTLASSTLTLSAHCLSLPLFSRVLSDKFNVGIVYSGSLSSKTITGEFKSASLSDVISVLSRQLDVDTVRVGNTFYIGKLRPEDRAVFVRKIFGFSDNDLSKACSSVLSDKGKLTILPPGIVTATDLPSVLVRLTELLDYLSSLHDPVWIIQLAFLTLNRDLVVEAGLKVTTSGTVAYNLDDNEFKLKDINIDGLINAAMRSAYTDVYSCPMLLCRDGSSSVWANGQRVPVPKKTVSSYGTVSVTGYDYVDTGLSVKVSAQSTRTGGCLLNLDISKSHIESYVDQAPLTSRNAYTLICDMQPHKLYLLGELTTFTDLNTQSDILTFGKSKGKQSIQVWGQVYRISPSLARPFPPPRPAAAATEPGQPSRAEEKGGEL